MEFLRSARKILDMRTKRVQKTTNMYNEQWNNVTGYIYFFNYISCHAVLKAQKAFFVQLQALYTPWFYFWYPDVGMQNEHFTFGCHLLTVCLPYPICCPSYNHPFAVLFEVHCSSAAIPVITLQSVPEIIHNAWPCLQSSQSPLAVHFTRSMQLSISLSIHYQK